MKSSFYQIVLAELKIVQKAIKDELVEIKAIILQIFMQEKLQRISEMQMLLGTVSLTPQQLIIAAVHAINLYNKLGCVNDKGQTCQFPINWKDLQNGAYVFNYTNLSNRGIVNFKFTVVEEKVVVVFGYQGSKQINKVTFNKNDSMQTVVRTHEFNLKQFLATQPTFQRPFHQSSNLKPNSNFNQLNGPQGTDRPIFATSVQSNYPPKNVIHSGQTTNPFGQQEYVGPNSQIFGNPYYQQTHIPNSSMIPPGARYDPIDPFDDPLRVQSNIPNDFAGFDQFGAPIQRTLKPRGVPGFNPFGTPGNGFGGGFGGGSRGGFGGGFGPVI